MRVHLSIAASCAALLLSTGAQAQDVYKIGMSAGLTGYAATVDRAWRDGVEIAIAALNAKGGIAGRKVELVVEDNRSEPQEAVTVYRKMISSDKVNMFASGCVSAGNFAAAPQVVRAETPMVLCSILPQQPDHIKWAFTTIPPPRFEVVTRLEYLKNKTQVKKIGVLHDPSPYANAQKAAAEKEAKDFGLEVVGIEQYKTDDADLSVAIQKMHAAGAREILKIGLGGTTLTAAKNIKQLGLDMIMLTAAAVEKAKSFDGPKLRDTLETMDGFQGTTGVYHFSASNHQGITDNPLLLATIINGKVQVVK